MAAPVIRWLESLGLSVRREFATPWGICDLVGLSFDKDRVSHRLALGQRRPIGPPLRIELLQEIPDVKSGRAITQRKLERDFQGVLTAGELDEEIAKLVEGGFVHMPRRGHLQKINGWAPLQTRIVAVELKLDRIADVLQQAACHVLIADEIYVGLPRQTAYRLVNSGRVDEFNERGVGVLAVTDFDCSVALASQVQGPSDPVLQEHCAERFWVSQVTGR